jgi:hypothetical protein
MDSSDQSILEIRRIDALSSAPLPSSDLGIQLHSAPKVNLEKVWQWRTLLWRRSMGAGIY